jgi:nitrite reductase/ring-hydroxylating ferredoxin subunit
MGQTEFFHFEVNGSSVPPDWQETKRRMREGETDASTQGAGFMAVARADELTEGNVRAFKVMDTKISGANVGGTFYAFDDTRTHEGCSLAEGELEETILTCGCHGSQFDVSNGELLRDPAQEPLKSYEMRVEEGNLEINTR